MDTNQDSTAWMSLGRVAAVTAVVGVHACAPFLLGSVGTHSTGWWAANVIDTGLRWCVPVFVMISGALLLDPSREESPSRFYARRASRIAVPLITWTAFYLALRFALDGLSAKTAARDLAAGLPYYHLYFLFALAGLYLLTPALRAVIRSTSKRSVAWLAAGLMAIGMIDQATELLAGAGGHNAATWFVPFLGFYVAGWLLQQVALERRTCRIALAVFGLGWALSLIGTAVTADGTTTGQAVYFYGYLSPPIVAMSLAAFVLLRRIGRAVDGPRVVALSAMTFGVYLVHPAFIHVLWRNTDGPSGVAVAGAIPLTVASIALAATGVVWALLRLPGVRRTVS
jgi:surface polysaccharide O-acyltransferase-like enzyme